MRRSALLSLLLLLAAALGAMLAIIVSNELDAHTRAEQWQVHTLAVIARAEGLNAAVAARQDAALRGAVLSEPSARASFARADARLAATMAELRRLTRDNPRQQVRLARLRALIDERGRLLAAAMAGQARSSRAAASVTTAIDQQAPARGLIASVVAEENALLAARAARARRTQDVVAGLGLGLAAMIALLLASAGWAVVSALRARHRARVAEALLDANLALARARDEAAGRDALLRTIGEAAPDPIYAKDALGRMLYCNPACLATIGRPLEEVLGRTELDWASDRRQAEAIIANDRAVMRAGRRRHLRRAVHVVGGADPDLSLAQGPAARRGGRHHRRGRSHQ